MRLIKDHFGIKAQADRPLTNHERDFLSFAVATYGHVLDNGEHDAEGFAANIQEVYTLENNRNEAVVNWLRRL